MTLEHRAFDRFTVMNTDGSSLSGIQAGAGEPVLVFVHGWAGHAEFWLAHLRHFSPNHLVVALDLSAHGQSQVNTAGYNIDSFAGDVAAVVNGLDLKHCILIGHSMGGSVALDAARKIPDRIDKVVMADSFVLDWGRFSEAEIEAFLAPFRQDFPAATRGLIEQTCTPDTDPAVIEQAAKVMCRLSPEVGLPALESLLRWDPLAALQSAEMPVHCINGSLDNPPVRERYAPFMTEHTMADAGHYLQMEDPQGFNRMLEVILS